MKDNEYRIFNTGRKADKASKLSSNRYLKIQFRTEPTSWLFSNSFVEMRSQLSFTFLKLAVELSYEAENFFKVITTQV